MPLFAHKMKRNHCVITGGCMVQDEFSDLERQAVPSSGGNVLHLPLLFVATKTCRFRGTGIKNKKSD